ncbi:MAG: hypothetical protein R6W97_12300 [Thiobacillus sp.]
MLLALMVSAHVGAVEAETRASLDHFAKAIFTSVARNDADAYSRDVLPSVGQLRDYLAGNDEMSSSKKALILKVGTGRIDTARRNLPEMIARIRAAGEERGLDWDRAVFLGTRALNGGDGQIDVGPTPLRDVYSVNGFLVHLSDHNAQYFIEVNESMVNRTAGTMKWSTYKPIKWHAGSRSASILNVKY